MDSGFSRQSYMTKLVEEFYHNQGTDELDKLIYKTNNPMKNPFNTKLTKEKIYDGNGKIVTNSFPFEPFMF